MNTGITVVAWSDGRRRHVPGGLDRGVVFRTDA